MAPDVASGVRWDGTDNAGKPARNGRYSFQIVPQGTEVAARLATTQSTAPGLGFASSSLPMEGEGRGDGPPPANAAALGEVMFLVCS